MPIWYELGRQFDSCTGLMESCVKENKCRNLHKVQFLLESYINYTEETKISTYEEKGEKTNTLNPVLFLL